MPRLSIPSILAAAVIFAMPASAQVNVGAQFSVGLPIGEFSERLDGAIGFGLSAQALYSLPRTPVAIGAELGFLVYGQETIRERFGSGPLGRVEIDVVTTNNIALGHALVRLDPLDGGFRPYGDLMLGVNYLFTESRIQDVRGDRPDIAGSTNFDDVALSLGGGIGFRALLLDTVSETGRPGQLLLDVRVRYLAGGEASYLKRGSIREDDDGELIFDVERSRTSLVMPQVGVVFGF